MLNQIILDVFLHRFQQSLLYLCKLLLVNFELLCHVLIDHTGHKHDSHVWLSPVISEDLAAVIKDELVAAMPEQESLFIENYEALITELKELHEKVSNFDLLPLERQQELFDEIVLGKKKNVKSLKLINKDENNKK